MVLVFWFDVWCETWFFDLSTNGFFLWISFAKSMRTWNHNKISQNNSLNQYSLELQNNHLANLTSLQKFGMVLPKGGTHLTVGQRNPCLGPDIKSQNQHRTTSFWSLAALTKRRFNDAHAATTTNGKINKRFFMVMVGWMCGP